MRTIYKELVRIPTFSILEVEEVTNSRRAAYAFLEKAMKVGAVKKIRNNLYTAVDMNTNQVLASKYQIACAASESAYISYQSAFEYHGLMRASCDEISISSNTRIREFRFEGVRYRSKHSKTSVGVVNSKNEVGVRVPNLERTVIDGLNDMDRIVGMDELVNVLSNIERLDEEMVLDCLKAYDLQMLYQKAGYMLTFYQQKLSLSKRFFDFCQSRIGHSKRYLTKDAKDYGVYDKKWKLIVPCS